ncbi:hypothetical protein TNCV_763581 [Trichonephila clavipes]|nr:hypothetical protein TNCV_763581 [Trichonephila clavipes]
MADRHTDLHVFNRGTLKSQQYRDDILAPYIKLFRGPNFICMDDNSQGSVGGRIPTISIYSTIGESCKVPRP